MEELTVLSGVLALYLGRFEEAKYRLSHLMSASSMAASSTPICGWSAALPSDVPLFIPNLSMKSLTWRKAGKRAGDPLRWMIYCELELLIFDDILRGQDFEKLVSAIHDVINMSFRLLCFTMFVVFYYVC